jgi:protein-(glutamine-N5) methyltransferase, release factor-specific
MTRKEAYKYGIQLLEEAGVQEAELDAWILLEEATQVTRAAYYADSHKMIAEEAKTQYMQWLAKRAMRIPLQHILGYQEFMGMKFMITPDVLIPRWDTETLVEYVEMQLQSKAQSKVLDMCTGSGCILLSLMKRNSEIIGTAVDISNAALDIARKNAKQLCVDADFVQSDLFEKIQGVYDVIVSNPPYIKEDEIAQLEKEVRNFDPLIALSGGEDGLAFYRRIVDESCAYLVQGGSLVLEIGCEQAQDVSEMMKRRGFEELQILKDLAGLDRIVHGVYNK